MAERRTRSGRSAPTVAPQTTTRRSRRSEPAEEPELEFIETEIDIADVAKDIVPAEDCEVEMVPETVLDEDDDNNQATIEDSENSNDGGSPEDQFIAIPDGNGLDNNGLHESTEGDVEMEMAEEPNSETAVPETNSVEANNSEGEFNSVVVEEQLPPSPPPDPKKSKPVATEAETMVTDDEPASALKRKTTTSVEVDTETKRQKIDATNDEVAVEPEVVAEPPPPKLPDLEKYWKPVIEDSTNFTGWTYLLQYVDQETDVGAAREAYDAFLAQYPYCYGYWRKYADYEKTKGDKGRCEEVFARGLKAIPLSVDLWIHYLNYVKATNEDDQSVIRSQYERALNVCGLEFRSDKLWEAYIKWETDGKRLVHVVRIYDRLLATPTLGYSAHFGNFSDLVNGHPPANILDAEALAAVEKEIGAEKAGDGFQDELEEKIRKKVLATRRKVHEATVQEVTNRWTFEEAIKRPYFHVKPLERCQLKNWSDYLEYETNYGDRRRIVVLFERCLIACALYEEYWQRYARYLMDTLDEDDAEMVAAARDVFERACTIHHKDKPSLHLMWSSFEECHGNIEKAAEILANADKVMPNLLQVEYRRINVERRRGAFDSCEELFKQYMAAAKGQQVASSLAIKYARFVHKIRNDLDRAIEILKAGQTSDPKNVRIPLQLIDLAMQRKDIDDQEVILIMDAVLEKDDLDAEQMVLFAQRKVEFLEDFGRSPKQLQKAQKALQTALTALQEQKKAKSQENNEHDMKRIHSTASSVAAPPPVQMANQYANYGAYYGAGGEAASYGSYSDANYWNQYGQQYGGGGSGGGNNYANYYQ